MENLTGGTPPVSYTHLPLLPLLAGRLGGELGAMICLEPCAVVNAMVVRIIAPSSPPSLPARSGSSCLLYTSRCV